MITITVESSNGNRYTKTFQADSFQVCDDKTGSRQGTAGGIYLPKTSIGKPVVAIVLDGE
jgi:putative transposon-encoded protein